MAQRREWLVTLRKRAGLSQAKLAALVGADRQSVYRWENGHQDFYDRHRPGLADALHVTLTELDQHEASYQGGSYGEWLAAGRRIGHDQAAAVAARVHALRVLDDSVAGRDLQPAVERELVATSTLLHEAVTTGQTKAKLFTVLGDLYQLAGWVAADSGDDQLARARYAAGTAAAEAAGDAPLAGQLASSLAYHLTNHDDPRNGAVLADSALSAANGRVPAVVEALLTERSAWAHALAGESDAADRALDHVDDIWSSPGPADPSWVYWLTAEEVDVMAGRCHVALGRPEMAQERLTRALGGYGAERPRETALYLSWLAEAHLQADDPDHAAGVASQVLLLASATASTRVTDRVRYLAALLAPHRSVPSVTAFLGTATDHLSP